MQTQNTTTPNEVAFVNGHEMDAKLKENDFLILVSDLTNGATYHWIWDKTKVVKEEIDQHKFAKQIADSLRLLSKDDISHDVELNLAQVLGGAIALPYALNSKAWEMSEKLGNHNSLYIVVDYDDKYHSVRTLGTGHNESVTEATNEGLNRIISMAYASGFVKKGKTATGLTMMDIVTPGSRTKYVKPGAPGTNKTPKKKKRKK